MEKLLEVVKAILALVTAALNTFREWCKSKQSTNDKVDGGTQVMVMLSDQGLTTINIYPSRTDMHNVPTDGDRAPLAAGDNPSSSVNEPLDSTDDERTDSAEDESNAAIAGVIGWTPGQLAYGLGEDNAGIVQAKVGSDAWRDEWMVRLEYYGEGVEVYDPEG